MNSPPDELIETTLMNLDGAEDWIRRASIKPGISEKTARALLTHPNKSVAAAAAIGEWHASPRGGVRSSLQSQWRESVVKFVDEDYQLDEMLRADEALAFDWLKRRLESDEPLHIHRHCQLQKIVETIPQGQRRTLLEIVPATYFHELITLLVGTDLDLYHHLVVQERLRDFHLAPLARSLEPSQQGTKTRLQTLNDDWVNKAIVAMDAAYTPRDVLDAIHAGGWGWSGNVSNMWAEWMKEYAALERNEDERIREIGRLGHGFAKSNYDRERAQERHRAVYGG